MLRSGTSRAKSHVSLTPASGLSLSSSSRCHLLTVWCCFFHPAETHVSTHMLKRSNRQSPGVQEMAIIDPAAPGKRWVPASKGQLHPEIQQQDPAWKYRMRNPGTFGNRGRDSGHQRAALVLSWHVLRSSLP